MLGQLQLRWIHLNINGDGLHGWNDKLVQRALDSLANDGTLAAVTTSPSSPMSSRSLRKLFLIFEDMLFKSLASLVLARPTWAECLP
jgi:hypothetical protein